MQRRLEEDWISSVQQVLDGEASTISTFGEENYIEKLTFRMAIIPVRYEIGDLVNSIIEPYPAPGSEIGQIRQPLQSLTTWEILKSLQRMQPAQPVQPIEDLVVNYREEGRSLNGKRERRIQRCYRLLEQFYSLPNEPSQRRIRQIWHDRFEELRNRILPFDEAEQERLLETILQYIESMPLPDI